MSEPTDGKPVETIKDAAQQAAKKETASPRVRRYRTVLFQLILFLAIGVFALLAFLVKTTPSFPIDLQVSRALQAIDSPIFAGLMRLISWPGFFPQSVVIILIIALGLYVYGLHWESVAASMAALFSGLINQLVKDLIQRPRPSVSIVDVFSILDSYSFPSGHVMFYTILFGFIWYLAYTLLKPSLPRSFLLGLFGLLILLVGVSRIYLGQHWASDVLGAYLLGGLVLSGIILLYQWGKPRFFVRQPVAPSLFKRGMIMFHEQLSRSIENFAMVMLPLSEKDLEREWIWKDHDEEGIRFAFFVTLEELRDRAVTFATLRSKPTTAQHILSQYHAAYLDLQAAVLEISNTDAERAPAEVEGMRIGMEKMDVTAILATPSSIFERISQIKSLPR